MHKAAPRTLRKAFRKLPKPCETQPKAFRKLPKPYETFPKAFRRLPKPYGTFPTTVRNTGGPAKPMQIPVFPGIFRKFR